MTYQEFLEKFKSWACEELSYDPAMIEFYPEGYTSEDPKELEWIIEANKKFSEQDSPWLSQDYILLKKRQYGTELVQRIAIHEVYNDSEKEGFESAVKEIREAAGNIINLDALNKRSEGKYDSIREQLILRPLNYKKYAQELGGYVYDRVGDIALVLYQLLGSAEFTVASSKIERDELEGWGIAKENVMRDALENTAKIFPACVMVNDKEEDFMAGEFTREDITIDDKYIYLSTFKLTNGALAIFYPGIIKKMMGIIGGEFIAVFMTINDVILFDKNSNLAAAYARAARTQDNGAEMLSARMYICNDSGVNPM